MVSTDLRSFHHGPGIQMSTIDRAAVVPRFPQTSHHGPGVKGPAGRFAPCGSSPSVGIWRADSVSNVHAIVTHSHIMRCQDGVSSQGGHSSH